MKLSCSKELLLNSINTVLKAVSNKTTLPILEYILLTAENDNLKLMANDLEIGIESFPIEAEVNREGSIALEAKLFSEIIKKVNGVNVTIDSDDNFLTKISSGSSEFKIMGCNGEDFPQLPSIERRNRYTISQPKLRDLIKQTIFSVSQNDSKIALTGELIEINNLKMDIVSVDGYRISYKEEEIEGSEESQNAIVPFKSLNEISKILSNEEDSIADIYFTDKHILFDIDGNIVVSRLIEGEFIKYNQSFVEDYKTRIDCDRMEMISALERASLLSRENRKTPVVLEIRRNKTVITSNTDIGTAYEEINNDFEGEDLKIAFNPRYLIEALRAVDDKRISLRFTSHLSPCIIKAVNDGNYKYLILPLRI